METPAAAAPAGSLFPSFLLLACGTLVAALLGAAHRLGLFYQLLHKVDKASVRHGGENVAAVLRAHGVRFIFTLVGGHISPLLVACEKLGIRVVDTRHEVTAVFAADAMARLSGTVGVAAVTAGPGLTNTVTAVKNAQMAQSPILLLGGAASTLLQNRGALQAVDQLSLFRPPGCGQHPHWEDGLPRWLHCCIGPCGSGRLAAFLPLDCVQLVWSLIIACPGPIP
nr:IlvB (bacterial acetolactate synthase)-like [Homo sapiens]